MAMNSLEMPPPCGGQGTLFDYSLILPCLASLPWDLRLRLRGVGFVGDHHSCSFYVGFGV